jgi:hypothetical protein
MSDDQDDKRKIIQISTRLPYEVPGPAEAIDADGPDEGCQAILESVQTLVANGQIRGLAILAWDAEIGRFERFVALPKDKDASNAALHFAGGIEILKESIMDIGIVEGGYADLMGDPEEFE